MACFSSSPAKPGPLSVTANTSFSPLSDKYTQYAAAIPLFIYSVLQGIFNQRLQDIAYYLTRPAFLTDFIFRIKAVIMQSQLDADIALGAFKKLFLYRCSRLPLFKAVL